MRILAFFILMLPFGLNAQTGDYKMIIKDPTTLLINGKTNVNTFCCQIIRYASTDTLEVSSMALDPEIIFKKANIYFRVNEIECGNSRINQDLRETLKSDDHPYIVLRLRSISLSDSYKHYQKERAHAMVDIEVAGVCKTYPLTFNDICLDNGTFSFKGEKTIDMTNFRVEPPTVLLGMVKVKEEIDISFDLQMSIVGTQQ